MRNVLITGASSGIGEACATQFAENGDNVILLARRMDKLSKIKESAEKINPRLTVHIVQCDVRDANNVKATIESLPIELRKIDVLVNSVGVTLGEGSICERNLDDWITMIDTNVSGVVSATHTVLPGMVERDKGHIITLGSTAGSYPRPGNPIYCGSKAFTKQFSLSLRADLKGSKVRVTSLEPGTVQGTEIALGRVNGDLDRLNKIYEGYDHINADDIASTVVWISNTPERMNINSLELMSTCQTFSHLTVTKK